MTQNCRIFRHGLGLLVLLTLLLVCTLRAFAVPPQKVKPAAPVPVWVLDADSFEFWRDRHGQYRGFYPELLHAINARYGYNLTLRPVDGQTFEKRFAHHDYGLYASVLQTKPNAENKTLSVPLFDTEVVAVSITRQAKNPNDLNNTRVIFRRHDRTQALVKKAYPTLELQQIIEVDTSKEALQILRSGGADFYINEDREMGGPHYYFTLSRPFPALRFSAAFGISPEQSYMRGNVNQLLNEWRQNGRLQALEEQSQLMFLRQHLTLTPAEQSWLRENRLTIPLPKNENFAPIIWKDERGYHGSAINMVNDLRDLLNIDVDVQFLDNYMVRMQNEDWPIHLADIFDIRNGSQMEGLIGPLVNWYNAYYNKVGMPFILDEEQVRHQRVGVIRGSFAAYYLRQRFGTDVTLVARASIDELLDTIDNHQIDFILGDLSSLEQALRGSDLFRGALKVAGLTHSGYQIGTWVNIEHPLNALLSQVHLISSYRHQLTPSSTPPATPGALSKNALQIVSAGLLVLVVFILSLMLMMWRHMNKHRAVNRSIVEAMEKINHVHDDETGCHIRRVAAYCSLLARGLKLPYKRVRDIENFASLHDIGKIAVPEHILHKQGKLTEDEFREIQQHSVKGWRIVQGLALGSVAENLIRHHHEKWDGSGYPDGLAGEAIPIEARILAIADVYDALRQKRVYKPSFSHERAYEIIVSSAGSHFDPSLVKLFCQLHLQFQAIYESQTD
ncbi:MULTISPECIES: HD domain-containing phosphohydrolase [unclassified Klebsiella]|uniref:HD domain-containing phosphohydrolase n=1 Tax=Enterobacteriaceae TaxID=543 RepID=UPI0015DC2EAD|nr:MULTISPECIES: HD domain-containing phosphohydrolase [unclassified Klebsiella]HAT3951930.1 transporter substrate-binding domain-containing protein [Kluyvera ascorbata]BBR59403.1 metal-dependent phosphohydrolase [Klebsiella sp. WP4-W18-ESBL-05]BBS91258.1 metal-dependent phosphohydrolase [Klebsiella sp. WP7-S18-CRE-02]BBS96280.1 metal-dependent phosphohydrolase [Klebsiella sp. WP7-S18-CRE-03]BBT01312.1 metal-dependent phosphohydrolase [Klebsiella sp. WP7-S18-ESBL-04]